MLHSLPFLLHKVRSHFDGWHGLRLGFRSVGFRRFLLRFPIGIHRSTLSFFLARFFIFLFFFPFLFLLFFFTLQRFQPFFLLLPELLLFFGQSRARRISQDVVV